MNKSTRVFVVYRDKNKQYRWTAHAGSPGGTIVANNADSHKGRAHTIRAAQAMAIGRPVFLKDWRSGQLVEVK